MYNSLQLALKYGRYLLLASNGRGHGIHSPFVYDFIRKVLIDQGNYPAYKTAEDYRKKLLRDHSILDVEDFGAGSSVRNTSRRTVSQITRVSVKPKRYSRLLYRLAAHYQYRNIIELGTSVGVTSTYLAKVPGLRKLVTIEGSPAIADYARTHFRSAELENTELVTGNFDEKLDGVLESMNVVELAFIDGNHRKEPTLDYFNKIYVRTNDLSCMVFDDIHWSREMEEAWDEIRNDQRVRVSIDLFFLGIVFFRDSFVEKQDFVIRF
jgi:predicted O-methyltransferase YrrM